VIPVSAGYLAVAAALLLGSPLVWGIAVAGVLRQRAAESGSQPGWAAGSIPLPAELHLNE
jgi:hypothetical protein